MRPINYIKYNHMKSALIKTSVLCRLFQLMTATWMMPFLITKTNANMYKSHSDYQPSKEEITLDRLKKGETGMVQRLDTSDSKNLQKLLAMGIVPGRIIRVLQTYPAYILQIDRTQAAMDRGLAQRIIVKK